MTSPLLPQRRRPFADCDMVSSECKSLLHEHTRGERDAVVPDRASANCQKKRIRLFGV